MLRITSVEPLAGHRLRLTLTNGQIVEREEMHLLQGTLFEQIVDDVDLFQRVRAANGTVEWPNGADLCPDVLIWGGPPPQESDNAAAPQGDLLYTR